MDGFALSKLALFPNSKRRLESFLLSGWNPYLLIFLIAAAPRIILGFLAPYYGLDWPIVYRVVAENIYLHLCVSQSAPASAACAPHWGGNQLPGFPAFVAFAWALSGKSDFAILLGQSLLTSVAICWLMHAIEELTKSRRIVFVVGLLTALSPVCLGWARSLNTEALAIAGTIWVLAELILSIAHKRLRILPLGIALACATLIRFDNLLLCLLVVFCAFAIHRPAEALRRGAAVAVVFATPLLIWTARSVAAGLPPIPTVNVAAAINPSGSVLFPTGMKKYYLSWLANATDQRTFSMPVYNGEYQEMYIPDRVFDTDAERRRTHLLLSKLSALRGKPIPKEIDDEFRAIAVERYAHDPFRQIIWLPLSRLRTMWINPFYSWGLPIGFEKAKTAMAISRKFDAGGTSAVVQAAIDNPGFALGKTIANGYWFSLLAAFAALPIFFLLRPPPRDVWIVSLMALVLLLVRSLFLVSIAQVETRYVVECVPAIEVAVVFGLAHFRRSISRTSARAGVPSTPTR